jgi:hypothetical protein
VDAIVEQTRPLWRSWDLTEAKARELAALIADDRFAAGVTACSCGGEGSCREQLIEVDVLTATARPKRH